MGEELRGIARRGRLVSQHVDQQLLRTSARWRRSSSGRSWSRLDVPWQLHRAGRATSATRWSDHHARPGGLADRDVIRNRGGRRGPGHVGRDAVVPRRVAGDSPPAPVGRIQPAAGSSARAGSAARRHPGQAGSPLFRRRLSRVQSPSTMRTVRESRPVSFHHPQYRVNCRLRDRIGPPVTGDIVGSH
jgi:hypothetical protein